MDIMGTEMHYFSLILSISKRASRGGLGSPAKGSETRMLVSTATICFSGGCARHAYNSSILTMHAKRLPDMELS